MCKVVTTKLARVTARFSRVYKGEVTAVIPAKHTAYQVDSVPDLMAFLATQRDVLAQNPGIGLEHTGESSLPTSAGTEARQTPPSTPTVAAQASNDTVTAEFTVKQSKSAKRASKKAASKGRTNGSALSGASAVNMASHTLASKQPSGKRRGAGKTQKRFEAFQRAEAQGFSER